MDRDSPMGGQMQLGDMEMRPIPMATLHLMALDTQAGTLTESNCRHSRQTINHPWSLIPVFSGRQ